MKILEQVRVLDLTNVLAGPFCCYQLAQFGADAIKIEAPFVGDLARQLGADTDLNRRLMGASFLAQNAGKRSLTVNLKNPAGKDIFRWFCAGALPRTFCSVTCGWACWPTRGRKANPGSVTRDPCAPLAMEIYRQKGRPVAKKTAS
jgi:hypothetical protein